MKTSFLIALVAGCAIAHTASAQKYKVKDDVITKDKAPIGKITGDAGVDKTDMVIYGNAGEKVLSMSQGRFLIKNPFFDWISWYTVKFEDTGKEMKIYHAGNCGPKCVLNNALAPKGIMLEGGVVKDQDAIIAKHDISEKLGKDTTEILNKHNLWLSLLTKNTILRDREKQVVVMKVKEDNEMAGTTITEYNIVQDNIILGKIVKNHMVSSTSVTTKYDFYEKLYQPEGAITEVPAGKVTDTFMDIRFTTVVDGKEHKMKFDDTANAQNALATYLVNNGYL
jgi:hypothetical protein